MTTVSLLQFIIIISTLVFLLFGIDLYKHKKMNLLHFLVFFLGSGVIILFSLNVNLLNKFWSVFGVARGADLFVYIWVILLFYLYITLLNKNTREKYELSRLISQEAINKWFNQSKEQINSRKNKNENDKFIFMIRAYNEEKTLKTEIDKIFQAWYHKIVFINDGSTDKTLDIMQQIKNKNPDKLIIILSHNINRGHGWAGASTKTWFSFFKQHGKQLNIERIVQFDPDGQMNIKDMQQFQKNILQNQKNIQKEINLYLGSRFTNWATIENIPFMRSIVLKIWKIVNRLFYKSKTSDPHSWYRVINLSIIHKLNITSDGMHYANEINEQISKHKIKYQEIPINVKYTEHSLQKGQKNSNSIRIWLEMIYKKLFFR